MDAQLHDALDQDEILTDLLARTSRTFALAIPCLPFPTRHEVTVAYLMFRIADTIEDGKNLNAEEKIAGLNRFSRIVGNPSQSSHQHLDLPRCPTDNPDYRDLLGKLPHVVGAASRLRPRARIAIVDSLQTSLSGMKRFIAAGTLKGEIRIKSMEELRDYCYIVAGVVGEMLTEVFQQGVVWSSDVRQELDANARWFGEGLQLVNILKDSEDDRRDGQVFVPDAATRSQLFDLAREDLRKADAYVQALKQADAPEGIVAFTQLPLLLAWRTLQCVEKFGPGSKVPRSDVLGLLAQVASYESATTAPPSK